MKMSLRNTAFFAAALGAALIFAGGAALAEVSVSGSVAVGVGSLAIEADETETIDASGEASATFEGKSGPLSAKLEIGIADGSDALDTAEHEVVWAVSDALSITISGFAFGIAAADGNTSVVNGIGAIGDDDAFLDYSDHGLFNVEYKTGGMTVGLGISDACVPSCGYAADDVEGDSETMTVVLHVKGAAGDLGYNAYYATSSGTFAGTDEAGSGSGLGFGVAYSTGDLGFGFDYSSATAVCNDAVTGATCTDDRATTLMAFSVTYTDFGFRYFSSSVDAGGDPAESTGMDLVYAWAVGDGKVGPEYRTFTNPDDTTDTLLLFGMSLEF